MKTIFKGANGFTVKSNSEHRELTNALEKRDKFIREYCDTKGWNIDKLSFEQIFEIRSQEGWKNVQ